MKKLFVIIMILLISCDFLSAQEILFEKNNANITSAKSINEKIERLKSREAIKNWEAVLLKPNISLSKNLKGIFNIFDKNIEFELTKDLGKDVNGIHGYKAELKDSGYAIISISENGISAAIWYEKKFCSFEWGCRMKKKFI